MEEKIIDIIFFGGIGFFCFIKYLNIVIRMKKYIKVQGKVVFVNHQYIDSVKGSHNKYIFKYDGDDFEVDDKFFGGNTKLKIGDDVYCYISRKDKSKIVPPEDIYNKNIYLLAAVVFISCIFVF